MYFAQIKAPYSCRKATPKLCSLAGGANGLQLSWVDFHIPIAFKYKTLLIKIIKLDLCNIQTFKACGNSSTDLGFCQY